MNTTSDSTMVMVRRGRVATAALAIHEPIVVVGTDEAAAERLVVDDDGHDESGALHILLP